MPRGRGSANKKVHKFRAVMSETISQTPIHVLANSVHALLARPDPLDKEEGRAVLDELDSILSKVQSAIQNYLDACSAASNSNNGRRTSGGGMEQQEKALNIAEGVVHACFNLITHALQAPECSDYGLSIINGTPLETEEGAEGEAAPPPPPPLAPGGIPHHMDTIKQIFMHVVFQGILGHQQAWNVLLVVDAMCESGITKENAGAVFTDHLRVMLTDSNLHHSVQRQVAACLINLVKCSKVNKVRLGDLGEIARALSSTTDFFMQLQCVELIFRCSRQNKALLNNLTEDLPPKLVRAIGMLPNDPTLLDKMIEMLQDWNASRDPCYIIRFQVIRVDAGLSPQCAAATAYFSPEHFIIMVPNSVNHITVSYSDLRSVKLSKKEEKICFRMAHLPPQQPHLAREIEIGAEDPTKEMITVFANQSVLKAFRESAIHDWITTALKKRGKQQISPLERPSGVVPELTSPPRSAADMNNNNHQHNLSASRAPQQLFQNPSGADGGAQDQQGYDDNGASHFEDDVPQFDQPRQQQPTRRSPIAPKSASRAAQQQHAVSTTAVPSLDLGGGPSPQTHHHRANPMAGQKRIRSDAFTDALGAAMSDEQLAPVPVGNDGQQQEQAPLRGAKKQRVEDEQQQQNAMMAPPPAVATRTNSGGGGGKRSLSGAAAAGNPQQMIVTAASEQEVENLVQQMKQIIDAKVASKREEAGRTLENTMLSVQQAVDECRQRNKSAVVSAADELWNEFDEVRAMQQEANQKVFQVVQTLNDQIAQAKQTNAQLKDRINCLEMEFPPVLAEAKAMEDECLRDLKESVENQMAELEGRIHARLQEQQNPVRFLSALVNKSGGGSVSSAPSGMAHQ